MNAIKRLADDIRSAVEYLRQAEGSLAEALAREQVLDDIAEERERQDEKWGQQNHRMADWLAILTEEVGEVAKAITECTLQKRPQEALRIREELVQTAAVCVAMVESFDRNVAPRIQNPIKERDI